MIFKFSFKSLKAQFRNYLIYFVSMTFAVMVYYCFSAITYNQPLVRRAGQNIQIARTMGLGGILIIIIILGFMLAVNRFLLLKRSKEIGLYRLVGMRKDQVSLLFFAETLILGAFSLIMGIAFGIIFSKLFSMMLAKAMFLSINSIFYLSIPSMVQTSIVFMFILLVVSIRSTWMIWRYPLVQLFQQSQERRFQRNLLKKMRILLAFLGLFLIIVGYLASYYIKYIVTDLSFNIFGIYGILFWPLLIFLICVIGTYLFFRYTLVACVQLLARSKKRYYKQLNPLIFSNGRMHILNNRNTLANVTLLIATALSMIGLAASLYTIGIHTVNITDPTDFIVSEANEPELKKVIGDYSNTSIKKSVTLNYKIMGSLLFRKIGKNPSKQYIELVNLLSLSNYRDYQAINPYLKPIQLKNDSQVVALDSFQSMIGGVLHYGPSIQLADGKKLTIQGYQSDFLGQENMRYNALTLIVTDRTFQQVTNALAYNLTTFNVQTPDEDDLADYVSSRVTSDWQAPLYYQYALVNQSLNGVISRDETLNKQIEELPQTATSVHGENWQLSYSSRYPDLRYARREMGLYVYVAMFVGILALFITGSILMLRQLFEGEREKTDYDLLKRMGVSDKAITKLIYQQNSLIFFPPMVIGILHASFSVYIFSQFVTKAGYWLAYISCGILIFIYILFYFFTSALYTRVIHNYRR